MRRNIKREIRSSQHSQMRLILQMLTLMQQDTDKDSQTDRDTEKEAGCNLG